MNHRGALPPLQLLLVVAQSQQMHVVVVLLLGPLAQKVHLIVYGLQGLLGRAGQTCP